MGIPSTDIPRGMIREQNPGVLFAEPVVDIRMRVKGEPVGQPRIKARIVTPRGKAPFVSIYTPGDADGWKACVKAAALSHRRPTPLDGPLFVGITFLFPRPQYLLKPKSPSGRIWMAQKPDRDNAEKATLDAIVDIRLIEDDKLIVDGYVRKLYVQKGEEPGAEIVILRAGEVPSREAVPA